MGGVERAEQRPDGLRLDRFRFPWQGPRPVPEITQLVQESLSSETPAGSGDLSDQVVRRSRKKEGREFFDLGGAIREADLRRNSKDIEAVQRLYAQDFTVEHFSHDLEDPKDDHPISAAQEIQDYYKKNPGAKLLLAELDGEVVGAITIAPEKGLNSVKLNRVVRREDKPKLGIAHLLIGEAVIRAFLKKPKGYQAASITIGVILDVEGSDEARKAFKKWEFITQDERDEGRCSGWSKEKGKMVPRGVEVMKLKRRDFALSNSWYLSRGTVTPTKKERKEKPSQPLSLP